MNTHLPVYHTANSTDPDMPVLPGINCHCVMGPITSRRPSVTGIPATIEPTYFQDAVNPGRPIHFIRRPSANPPPFEADAPPPTLKTPPPGYDSLTPLETRDGWEYFWGNPIMTPRITPQRTVTTDSEHREMGSNESDSDEYSIDYDQRSIVSIDEELMVRVPSTERRLQDD